MNTQSDTRWITASGLMLAMAVLALAALGSGAAFAQVDDIPPTETHENSDPGAGTTEIYYVDKVKYTNNGSYKASFLVKYKVGDQVCETLDANMWQGESRTFNLKNMEGRNNTGPCSSGIPEGSEIWGLVRIGSGDTETCKKDGPNFFYKEGSGKVSYKTGGTTKNKNRCKLVGKQ